MSAVPGTAQRRPARQVPLRRGCLSAAGACQPRRSIPPTTPCRRHALPPCSYQGARTAPEFLSFLADKVKSDAGFARVDELDGIAAKFEDADDKAALLEQARTAAATVAGAPARLTPQPNPTSRPYKLPRQPLGTSAAAAAATGLTGDLPSG